MRLRRALPWLARQRRDHDRAMAEIAVERALTREAVKAAKAKTDMVARLQSGNGFTLLVEDAFNPRARGAR